MTTVKVVYKSGEIYLIKINDEQFYFGNGATINVFGISATQFLRFNPYMKDVSESDIEIPQKIVDYINEQNTTT